MAAKIDSKTKAMEKNFGDILGLYIYAAFDDIRHSSGNIKTFDTKYYQNYANVISGAKKDLMPAFNISSEVKQVGTKIYRSLIEEIAKVNPGDIKDSESIHDAVEEECVFSYTVFAINFAKKVTLGKVVIEASDKKCYFQENISAALPQFKANLIALGHVTLVFDRFLKTLATVIANQIWYNPVPINHKYILATLASHGLDSALIKDLTEVRKKVASVKNGEKKDDVKVEINIAANTTAANTTVENTTAANTTVENTTVVKQEEDFDDLFNL